MAAVIFGEEATAQLREVVRKVLGEMIPERIHGYKTPPFLSIGVPIYLGKTTTAHDKGSTETVNLYAGSTKGSEDRTTFDNETVEAYNRFADVDNDKWVLVAATGGDDPWELIAAEC